MTDNEDDDNKSFYVNVEDLYRVGGTRDHITGTKRLSVVMNGEEVFNLPPDHGMDNRQIMIVLEACRATVAWVEGRMHPLSDD